MANADEILKKIEVRLVELEKRLDTATRRAQVTPLSADEIKAYHKVREVLAADWGDMCGINDCFRCIIARCVTRCVIVTRCVVRCINECACGPCAMSSADVGLGGIARFSDIGE